MSFKQNKGVDPYITVHERKKVKVLNTSMSMYNSIPY